MNMSVSKCYLQVCYVHTLVLTVLTFVSYRLVLQGSDSNFGLAL